MTQWEEESDWRRGERLDFRVLGSGRDTNLECMIKKEERGVTNLSGGRSTEIKMGGGGGGERKGIKSGTMGQGAAVGRRTGNQLPGDES